MDLSQRLLSKVRKKRNGCWEWTGAYFSKTNGKYGQIRMTLLKNKSANRFAHRVSYEYFIGPVPKGLELDHMCRNTLCINPSHLEPVTHKENMRRRIDINKSHCNNGHCYTQDNTYIRPDGKKECRICRRERARKFYEKRK